MTIIEKLKEIFANEDYFSPYDIPMKNWPEIEFDGELEPLDMENWEVTELTDDHMIMKCGGDWQEPNDFEVVKCEPTEFGMGDEINMDEVLGLE